MKENYHEMKKWVRKKFVAAAVGAAFLFFSTVLPLTGRLYAEEKNEAPPKLSSSVSAFYRYDIKSKKNYFGFAGSSGSNLGPFTIGVGAGAVTDGKRTQLDLISLSASRPFALGDSVSLTPGIYLFRDLQAGVTRGEGAGLTLSAGNLSVWVNSEHLEGDVYPQLAGVGVGIGPFSAKLNGILVIAPKKDEPNLGGRVFLNYSLTDSLGLGGNFFIMTNDGQVLATTTQVGISASF